MKAAVILSLAFSAAAGAADAPVRTTPFPDVPRDHWAFDAVESLRQKGILRGYPMRRTKLEGRTAKGGGRPSGIQVFRRSGSNPKVR